MLEWVMVLMSSAGSPIMSKQCCTLSGQVLNLTTDKALLLKSSFPGRVVTGDALPDITAQCAEMLKVRKRQLMKD